MNARAFKPTMTFVVVFFFFFTILERAKGLRLGGTAYQVKLQELSFHEFIRLSWINIEIAIVLQYDGSRRDPVTSTAMGLNFQFLWLAEAF